jgi:hypothetical protein
VEHGVDECAAGAAVAVDERVDRLELRMGDRGAHDRVAGRVGDEVREVGDEPRHFGFRRRDELGPQWAPPRTAHPVLLAAQPRFERRLDGVLQAFDVGDGDGSGPVGECGDGGFGRSHVADHVERDPGTPAEGLGDRQPLRADAVALDPRRRDALRPDQQVIQVGAAGPDPLVGAREHRQCILCRRLRRFTERGERGTQLVGDEGSVSAGRAILPPELTDVIGIPYPFDEGRHRGAPQVDRIRR